MKHYTVAIQLFDKMLERKAPNIAIDCFCLLNREGLSLQSWADFFITVANGGEQCALAFTNLIKALYGKESSPLKCPKMGCLLQGRIAEREGIGKLIHLRRLNLVVES